MSTVISSKVTFCDLAKIRLIADDCNCSYSPCFSTRQFLSIFLQKYDSSAIYSHCSYNSRQRNLPMSRECTAMTQSVARPSYLVRCQREIFTAALLLAAAFFFDCMKMSSAKDVSSTLNRRS